MSISRDMATASTGTLPDQANHQRLLRLSVQKQVRSALVLTSGSTMAEQEQPIMQSFFNPSSIFAWTLPRHFPESKAKGACLRIPDSQTDISDRHLTISEQSLSALDAPLHVILVRRHTE
jgi:hypothetical protein